MLVLARALVLGSLVTSSSASASSSTSTGIGLIVTGLESEQVGSARFDWSCDTSLDDGCGLLALVGAILQVDFLTLDSLGGSGLLFLGSLPLAQEVVKGLPDDNLFSFNSLFLGLFWFLSIVSASWFSRFSWLSRLSRLSWFSRSLGWALFSNVAWLVAGIANISDILSALLGNMSSLVALIASLGCWSPWFPFSLCSLRSVRGFSLLLGGWAVLSKMIGLSTIEASLVSGLVLSLWPSASSSTLALTIGASFRLGSTATSSSTSLRPLLLLLTLSLNLESILLQGILLGLADLGLWGLFGWLAGRGSWAGGWVLLGGLLFSWHDWSGIVRVIAGGICKDVLALHFF